MPKKRENYQLRYDLAGKFMQSLTFVLFYRHVINAPFIISSQTSPIRLMCLQLLGLFLLPVPKLWYVLGEPRPASVELQTVSANCLRKGHREEEEEEELTYPDGCLRIIPGEAPTAVTSPVKELPATVPPVPPPLPAELTNGVGALPNVLRKMNGNSYMLLQQQEEPLASPLYNASFTEELSKFLEKRKHTQLVEKLDESSV